MFRIKEARERVGLTQKELADSLGIKPSTFNGYEKGTHDPKSDILMAIADKCGVSVDYLLGVKEKAPAMQELSAEEILLIQQYRSATEQGRQLVLHAAKFVADAATKEFAASSQSPESFAGNVLNQAALRDSQSSSEVQER